MLRLDASSIEQMLLGATLLGTGGGGSSSEAREAFLTLFSHGIPRLITVSELSKEAISVSAFGVGTMAGSGDVSVPLTNACKHLSAYIGSNVSAIVPVEIGPKSLASAFFAASVLGVPVLDADIVGGRSSPEVFLETITLFDIPRVPVVVANALGEAAILLASCSPKSDERFMRDFARMSAGECSVVGYILNHSQVSSAIEHGTVSQAIEIGALLQSQALNTLFEKRGGRLLFRGEIIDCQTQPNEGFLCSVVLISNGSDTAKLFVRNEYLILWVNDEIVSSCPDLIICLDDKGMPIQSSDLALGTSIQIGALRALPLWRSQKGLSLFCPRTFGVDCDPVLIP